MEFLDSYIHLWSQAAKTQYLDRKKLQQPHYSDNMGRTQLAVHFFAAWGVAYPAHLLQLGAEIEIRAKKKPRQERISAAVTG